MPPFEPASWTYRGTIMPAGAGSVVPTGYWINYKGYLYVVYQGQYTNVSGYPYANMDIMVGAIVRTADGLTWTTSFDGGAANPMGQPRWMPGQLFVIGDTLYCFIAAGGTAFVAPWAIIPAGEIALMSTTDGVTWTKVQSFISWPASNNGVKINRSTEVSACHWHARRSSAGGDEWLIVGWAVRNDGTTGSYYIEGTQRYRSSDGGLTWDFVAEMKHVTPFTANPNSLDAPWAVYPIWRSPSLGDRWFMFGGSGTMNWSDDEGATWTPTTWSTLPSPAWAYPLSSGALVILNSGSSASPPNVKVSCDLGESATNVPAAQTYQGYTPANVFVASLQFQAVGPGIVGEGGEELLAVMRDNTGTATSIWWSDDGGETWSELGQLGTWYTVPVYLARLGEDRVLLYSAATAAAGGPQLWTCDDAPSGVLGPHMICTDLTPIFEEEEPEVAEPPPQPIHVMSTWSLRVSGVYKP